MYFMEQYKLLLKPSSITLHLAGIVQILQRRKRLDKNLSYKLHCFK